jgi:membrane fusion protein (multidrug efflux system)
MRGSPVLEDDQPSREREHANLDADEPENASHGRAHRPSGYEPDDDDGGKHTDKRDKPAKRDDHDDNRSEGKDGHAEKDGDDKPKSRWPIIVLIIVVVLAAIGAGIYWFATRNEESTDDAYTEGNAVSIAPKVSGYVIERHVDDNSFVRAGDLMIRIDPRDYIAARDQARANLDVARAQLTSAQIDLEISRVRYPADLQQARAQVDQARANEIAARREFRRQRSVDQRATTQASVDQATSQYESTSASEESALAQLRVASLVDQNIQTASTAVKQRQAQVEQAEANLAQAELNLSYTRIVAPQDGLVTRRNVDVGTYAQAGQQIFYLVPTTTWVVANFKETQLTRIHPGEHVVIHVDAYPSLKLRGHIDSIQQGAGARFTAFPAENATGNFVKIVRRVPVKIIIDDGMDPRRGLPLGLSVEPTVTLQ